ncbi:hypothetical protein KY343_02125 [Candidatus Woesearchaeota archaeon]|nr:hypothetical protein [Candidatus Woesearchaeota archaeon]
MKKRNIRKLKEKGWSEEDIRKTEEIIERRRREDKSRTFISMNRVLYWSAIVVIVLGNFIISIFLIPFLLVLKKLSLDIIIVTIAFAFGLLFNLLITDIEHVEKKHHLFALIMIPLIALINFVIMVNVANSLGKAMNLSFVRENPYFISLLYIVAFILPYLYTLIIKKEYKEWK